MNAAGVGHLSIGEVLSLVQEDFPDVTISKIRFLESQGLIAPERTAAGYRKFYDSDIERLRWILRQQRDHFLPLKVIRKMLDQGVDVSPDSESQPTLWSSAASGPAGEPDDSGDHREPGGGGEASTIDVTDQEGPSADDSARSAGEDRERYRSPAHPAVASAHRRAEPPGDRPSERRGNPGQGASTPAGGDRSAGSSDEIGEDPTPAQPDRGAGAGDAPPAEQPSRRPAYSTPADVVAALQEEPRSARRRQRGPGTPAEPPEPVPASAPSDAAGGRRSRASSARMSRAELCEAAGLTSEQLDDLEDFGLVAAKVLGGDPQYDEGALEVARIAARYAELGVGARHLRMYKVAAEREAGFVEQLVVPLLKQRNPAARGQAETRADELQRMGADLHAALLRRRLDPTFGD